MSHQKSLKRSAFLTCSNRPFQIIHDRWIFCRACRTSTSPVDRKVMPSSMVKENSIQKMWKTLVSAVLTFQILKHRKRDIQATHRLDTPENWCFQNVPPCVCVHLHNFGCHCVCVHKTESDKCCSNMSVHIYVYSLYVQLCEI